MGMIGDAILPIVCQGDPPALAFGVVGDHRPWQAFDFAVLVAGGEYEEPACKRSLVVTMDTPWIACERRDVRVMDVAHLELEKLALHALQHIGSVCAWLDARCVVQPRSMQVASAIVQHGDRSIAKP